LLPHESPVMLSHHALQSLNQLSQKSYPILPGTCRYSAGSSLHCSRAISRGRSFAHVGSRALTSACSRRSSSPFGNCRSERSFCPLHFLARLIVLCKVSTCAPRKPGSKLLD